MKPGTVGNPRPSAKNWRPYMLNPDQKALVEFVNKYSPLLPLAERAAIYRGLADFTDVLTLVQMLSLKARALEEAEAKCHELDLGFTEGAKQ